MPIYTYRCENCGVQFDRRQHFDDDPLIICPECETETLRKVYLPVGIVFKGSGFYSTDNRSASGTESRHKSEESSASNQKNSEDGREKSKPDQKKTSKTSVSEN